MSEKETISEKMKKLEEKISWFYSPDFSLDMAVENYKSAKSLSEEIENDLKNLKNEITILSADFK